MVNGIYISDYVCDSKSVIKKISYSGKSSFHVNCWGVFVTTYDDTSYPALIAWPPGHGVNNITLNVKNYTEMYINNNGNIQSKGLDFFQKIIFYQGNTHYMECGTITGGPCDGDEIWGVGEWMADDQKGCSCK